MQKKLVYIIMVSALVSALLFAACGKTDSTATGTGSSTGADTPNTKSVTMVLTEGETSKLDEIKGLASADLRGSECYEEIYQWAQAHPDVVVRYTVPLPNGSNVTNEIAALDMSSLTHDGVEQLIKSASCLPNLSSIELGYARDNFGWEDVLAIVEAFPELKIGYVGEVYGVTVQLSDTDIDLKYIQIDDGGAEIRTVMSCMPGLKTVDMDSCGLDDETMAAIQADFPDVKVIWRVYFGECYSVRTDVEKILASKPSVGGMLTAENTKSLKYCTDVKYLDIGHNESLTDISFLAYMPKLEVCIIAMDGFNDISPIANCVNMEYLELQTNDINDLSPLTNLVNIEHLNICNLTNGDVDLTPLYGMTKLERLWIGGWTSVDRSQVEELQQIIPDCEINTSASDPTEGRWRYIDINLDTWVYTKHERYRELVEQFGYTDNDYAFYWNDPLCPLNFD
jgi:hypothetical protein